MNTCEVFGIQWSGMGWPPTVCMLLLQYIPSSNGTESPFFQKFGCDLAEGWKTNLSNCSRYYGNNRGK